MIVLGNFLVALGGLVSAVLSIASTVLFVRILFSWLRPNPPAGLLRSVVQGIYQVTDPVLDRARSLFPFLLVGALDLSPIAVFLGLSFLQRFLGGSLMQLGHSLM